MEADLAESGLEPPAFRGVLFPQFLKDWGSVAVMLGQEAGEGWLWEPVRGGLSKCVWFLWGHFLGCV